MNTGRQRTMLYQKLEDIDEKIKRIPELSRAMEALSAGSDADTPEMRICKLYKDLKALERGNVK